MPEVSGAEQPLGHEVYGMRCQIEVDSGSQLVVSAVVCWWRQPVGSISLHQGLAGDGRWLSARLLGNSTIVEVGWVIWWLGAVGVQDPPSVQCRRPCFLRSTTSASSRLARAYSQTSSPSS